MEMRKLKTPKLGVQADADYLGFLLWLAIIKLKRRGEIHVQSHFDSQGIDTPILH